MRARHAPHGTASSFVTTGPGIRQAFQEGPIVTPDSRAFFVFTDSTTRPRRSLLDSGFYDKGSQQCYFPNLLYERNDDNAPRLSYGKNFCARPRSFCNANCGSNPRRSGTVHKPGCGGHGCSAAASIHARADGLKRGATGGSPTSERSHGGALLDKPAVAPRLTLRGGRGVD